jgi:hypothetical protein
MKIKMQARFCFATRVKKFLAAPKEDFKPSFDGTSRQARREAIVNGSGHTP